MFISELCTRVTEKVVPIKFVGNFLQRFGKDLNPRLFDSKPSGLALELNSPKARVWKESSSSRWGNFTILVFIISHL